jgi:hypothetical protein
MVWPPTAPAPHLYWFLLGASVSVMQGGFCNNKAMKIAKPLLTIATPIGLADGFYECYRLAGGLLFLMVAMVGVMVVALVSVVTTIRREERQSQNKEQPCKT